MIAIVPARSGSKGLPSKNLMKLCGKSLVQRAVETGRGSEYIDQVIISTDDETIAEEAMRWGALCPFLRPTRLATDDAPVIETYIYTIDRLNNEYQMIVNELCILQPTSPLRSVQDVNNAIRLFYDKNADSVVSYTRSHHPLEWHKQIDEDFSIQDPFDAIKIKNRQDYRSTYCPNGAVYVFKYSILLAGRYYTDKSYAYVMPKARSVDIDDALDFKFAETIFREDMAKNEYQD